MKKILVLLTLILLLTGCNGTKINDITYKELNKRIDSKESFILFFGDDENLEKNLNKALTNNQLEAYKLDIKKLSKEEINTLKLSINYENPSIVFILEGKDPSILSHITDTNTTAKEIENRLIDMNFIK